MKLLGNFVQNTGNKYIDFLKEKGIEAQAEITPREYVSDRGMQRIVMDVKLLVTEADYNKALALIKECDIQSIKKVEQESKEVNKVMLKIVFVIICVICLIGTILTYLGLAGNH